MRRPGGSAERRPIATIDQRRVVVASSHCRPDAGDDPLASDGQDEVGGVGRSDQVVEVLRRRVDSGIRQAATIDCAHRTRPGARQRRVQAGQQHVGQGADGRERALGRGGGIRLGGGCDRRIDRLGDECVGTRGGEGAHPRGDGAVGRAVVCDEGQRPEHRDVGRIDGRAVQRGGEGDECRAGEACDRTFDGCRIEHARGGVEEVVPQGCG